MRATACRSRTPASRGTGVFRQPSRGRGSSTSSPSGFVKRKRRAAVPLTSTNTGTLAAIRIASVSPRDTDPQHLSIRRNCGRLCGRRQTPPHPGDRSRDLRPSSTHPYAESASRDRVVDSWSDQSPRRAAYSRQSPDRRRLSWSELPPGWNGLSSPVRTPWLNRP